jgi:hypothetical protein
MEQHNHLRTPRPSRAFIIVFVALGLIGVLALWTAVRLILHPPEQPNAFIGPLLIGSILTGIGVIMPFVLMRAGRREVFRAQMVRQNPGQPWSWREDWHAGRIIGSTPAAARLLWLVTFVWNGFTWPVAWLFLSQPDHEPGLYFVLLFPAAGVLLLGVAVRGTLQARKYGSSVFVMKTVPGAIGRTIEGDIETRIETAPGDGFDVRLQCTRRYTTGYGKHRRTHRQTLWTDHVTVQPADVSRGPLGLRIPVAFAIPPSARPTYDVDPHEGIEWHITVNAMTTGVDYSDSFEVPVFATGAPALSEAERDALMAGRRAHAAIFVPVSPVMRVSPAPTGGTEFLFKPEVKLKNAAGAIVMTVLSWAATYYLIQRSIPIAPYFAGFFAVLFSVGTLFALFHSSSVSVADGAVVIRHRVLGMGTTRRFAAGEIIDVKSEVVGEGNAQSFEVKVFTRGGKSFSAGAMIPTQVEADWSAEQLRRTVLTGTAARTS